MRWSRCAVAIAAGVLSLVSLPSTARAELIDVRAVYMTWEMIESCAVSVEVTKSEGGHTDGTETLSIGASYNYSFASGSFSPKAGGFGVGSSVLYGSPSFEKQTGAKVDISIPDAVCADFNRTGGELRFSGSLGRNPDIARITIPIDFGTRRAIDALGRDIDLGSEELEYGGYTGRWRLGYGGMVMNRDPLGPSMDDGEDGSCSVSPGHTSSSSLFALVPTIVLGAIVARRRRR